MIFVGAKKGASFRKISLWKYTEMTVLENVVCGIMICINHAMSSQVERSFKESCSVGHLLRERKRKPSRRGIKVQCLITWLSFALCFAAFLRSGQWSFREFTFPFCFFFGLDEMTINFRPALSKSSVSGLLSTEWWRRILSVQVVQSEFYTSKGQLRACSPADVVINLW